MKIRLLGWVLAAAAIGFAATACTLASPTHIDVQPSPDTGDDDGGTTPQSTSPTAAAGAGGTCSGSFTKPDVSTLPPCGNGKGHCYDKDKTPAPTFFTDCPTDPTKACVEDTILAANGSPLKSCKSIIGAGGCIDIDLMNVPDQFRQEAKSLTQDVCDSGEVCAPCTDPTNNNAPTGICAPMGVFSAPCTPSAGAGDGGAAAASTPSQACCTSNGKSNGICIASSAIPAGEQGNTVQDTCTGDNQCVPAALVSGAPVKCSAGLLGSGICMDKCFSSFISLAGTVGILDSTGCGETEVCLPCFVVTTGGTAVPGCS